MRSFGFPAHKKLYTTSHSRVVQWLMTNVLILCSEASSVVDQEFAGFHLDRDTMLFPYFPHEVLLDYVVTINYLILRKLHTVCIPLSIDHITTVLRYGEEGIL